MTILNPLGRLHLRTAEPAIGPHLFLVAALAAVLVLAAVFHHTMPVDAFAPGVTVLFLVLAAGAAILAWRWPRPAREFTYWDVAGILTLIGVSISAAVEPEQMVRLIAGADSGP